MVYRVVKFRRRRENKTDYNSRLCLLKSGIPRIVMRKTSRYIIIQLVESKEAQDKTLYSTNSAELLKNGWPENAKGSLKSLPAAYLTGYLMGTKLKKANVKQVIADMGLARSTKGSRIYAAIKGMIDAGVNLPASEKILPTQERIEGKHMKNKISISDIKSKIK